MNKPKLLIGLNQKGNAVGYPLVLWGYTDKALPAQWTEPNPLICYLHETW